MHADERRQLIVELLQVEGRVQVADLMRRTGVSDMTIRRDLDELERLAALRRVHGGAVPASSRSYEPPFGVRTSLRRLEKQRIGKAAASLVSDGDTVVLDAGTTTICVAQELVGRSDLTVATPSLRVAEVLTEQPGVRLLVTGGFVRPDERSLVGQPAEDAFRAFHFDLAFLTVGGIDLATGVTEYNVDDARVKRAALESAARTVAVADSSKLARVAFARVCAPDEFDVLVTDDGAPAKVVEGFEKLGVQVIIA